MVGKDDGTGAAFHIITTSKATGGHTIPLFTHPPRAAEPDVPAANFGNMEPVAWALPGISGFVSARAKTAAIDEWPSHYTIPLYTHPPRTALTDAQLLDILQSLDACTARLPGGFRLFARAIEAAHGIKEKV
jgi:hypothetical protein